MQEEQASTNSRSKFSSLWDAKASARYTRDGKTEIKRLPFELSYLNTAVIFGFAVAISPLCFSKLRGADNDLRQGDAGRGGQCFDIYVYASVESKNQAGMIPVQDQIPAGQQDLPGGRRYDGRHRHIFLRCSGCHVRMTVRLLLSREPVSLENGTVDSLK